MLYSPINYYYYYTPASFSDVGSWGVQQVFRQDLPAQCRVEEAGAAVERLLQARVLHREAATDGHGAGCQAFMGRPLGSTTVGAFGDLPAAWQ